MFIRVSQPQRHYHFRLDSSLLGGCPGNCKMFSIISGLYRLDVSNILPTQVVTTKSVSRHCQVVLSGMTSALVGEPLGLIDVGLEISIQESFDAQVSIRSGT